MTLWEMQQAVSQYADEHQHDVDIGYESHEAKLISLDEYHHRIITSGKIMEYRVVADWQELSPEDQITYYLSCIHQSWLVGYLSSEQKTAVILIQDTLVNYDVNYD